jgi:hypothetical protein
MPNRSVVRTSTAPSAPVTETSKLGISSSPSSKAESATRAVELDLPSVVAGGSSSAATTSNGERSSESGQLTIEPVGCSTDTVSVIRSPTVASVVSTSVRTLD